MIANIVAAAGIQVENSRDRLLPAIGRMPCGDGVRLRTYIPDPACQNSHQPRPRDEEESRVWLSTWLVPGAQCVAVVRSSMGPRQRPRAGSGPCPARRSSAQSRFRGFRLPGFPYFMQRPHQAVLRTCGHAWSSVAVLRTRSNWSVISGRSLSTIPRFLGFVFSGFRDFLSPHLSRLVRSVFPGSCISGFPYYVVSGYRDIG